MTQQTTPDVRVPRQIREAIRDVAVERTRPSMPPRISQLDLVGRVSRRTENSELVSRAVDQLVRNMDLLRYSYDDRRWLTPMETERIRRWIAAEAETDQPDRELIGALNQALQEVPADD